MDEKAHNFSTFDEIWTAVLQLLEKGLRKPTFDTWIRPTKLIELDENMATVAVKNDFARNFISQSYIETIQKAIKEVLAASVAIRITVDSSLVFEDENQQSLALIAGDNVIADKSSHANFNNSEYSDPARFLKNNGRIYDPNLNNNLSFDNYVVGKENEFSLSVSKLVSDKPGDNYNPLFVSSETGLGKTHLLNAIGNQVIDQTDRKVCYTTAEKFTNELINSFRQRDTEDFRKKYRSFDLLLFDDVQFLENKNASQEEFFHTFNSIVNAGGQLVVSSNKPLSSSKLDSHLKNRLQAGLETEIAKPDYDTRVQILERKVETEELNLSTNIIQLLAERCLDNVRELEGALTRLMAYSSVTHQSIDDELVVKLFGSSYRHGGFYQGLTIEKICKTVAKYFGIKLPDLLGNSRLKEFTKARHLAVYLAHDLLQISNARIGQYFSGRKHSTIIHSIKLIQSELVKDRSLALMIDDIKHKLCE